MLYSCSHKDEKTTAKPQDEYVKRLPDQISWDVVVKFVDSSFTKAILRAHRARIYRDKNETILDSGVECEFLSKSSQKRVSLLTADSVVIDDVTKNMLAGGHVYIYSDSSRTKVNTSFIQWNQSTMKLYSTEYVSIHRPNESLQGYGFESDQYLTNYTIFRPRGEQR